VGGVDDCICVIALPWGISFCILISSPWSIHIHMYWCIPCLGQ